MRLLAFLLLACSGCSTTPNVIAPHSHLWTDSPCHNIWTYEQVTNIKATSTEDYSKGFIERKLISGDKIFLSNGIIVTFDGDFLRINDTFFPENTLNCVINHDGSIEWNAFIRDFE